MRLFIKAKSMEKEQLYDSLPIEKKFELLLADYKRLSRYATRLEQSNANLTKENNRLESERVSLYLKSFSNKRKRNNLLAMFVGWLKSNGYILINEESIEIMKLIEEFEQKQMTNTD